MTNSWNEFRRVSVFRNTWCHYVLFVCRSNRDSECILVVSCYLNVLLNFMIVALLRPSEEKM